MRWKFFSTGKIATLAFDEEVDVLLSREKLPLANLMGKRTFFPVCHGGRDLA